jgi:NAD(P)-dependent dehydrogenase (short-subunit alcohol dehydrogenase family)
MGRLALVTGGSRGIGKAISQELSQGGYTVLTPPRAELDLAAPASITAYVGRLRDRPIDCLVNNAGINELGILGALSESAWKDMLQTNLTAPLMLIQALMPGMKSRRWGRIVNVSSIWSELGREARGGYAATKSALNGLTRAAAVEAAPHQVLVNAVAPGYIATELTFKNNSPADIAGIEARIPARRLGQPEEIARVVRFLCSEENTYLTGQVLTIDGGFSIV